MISPVVTSFPKSSHLKLTKCEELNDIDEHVLVTGKSDKYYYYLTVKEDCSKRIHSRPVYVNK